MSRDTSAEPDFVSLVVPPGWHLATGLVVSFGFPMAGACAIAGWLLDSEAFWWTAAALFVIVIPFALGLELLARSSVKARHGSLKGCGVEFAIQRAKIRMLSRAEIESSMARLRLVDPGVFPARIATWIVSVLIVFVAAVLAFM